MEQSRYGEANSSSASQEILRTLWKLNVHYSIHKNLWPVPVLIQINLVRVPYTAS
jgi:hypothetical protein